METSVSLRPTQFASELVSDGAGTSVSTGVEEEKMDSDAGRFGDRNPCALSSVFSLNKKSFETLETHVV